MKKFLSLLFALCVALCLAACGEDTPAATGSSTPETTAPIPTEPKTKTVYVHSSISQQSANLSTRTEYIFDENDRVTEVVQYTDSAESSRYTVECDENGNFAKWIGSTYGVEITVEYAYDDQGHVLSVSYFQDDEPISSTEYIWDGDLRTAVITKMPAQNMENRTEYIYDENGRLIRMDVYLNGELTSYSVCTTDDQGRLTDSTAYQPDGTAGVSTAYFYEGNTETRISTQPDGTVSMKMVITYDDHGNTLSSTLHDSENNVLSSETHTWKAVEVPIDCPRASV